MASSPVLTDEYWEQLWEYEFNTTFTLRTWMANIGVSLPICTHLWAILAPEHAELEPRNLLWSLSFLKLYTTYDHLAVFWRVSVPTLAQKIWNIIFFLSSHLNNIRIDDRFEAAAAFGVASLVLDGKFCPMEVDRRDWQWQALWYSGKHKHWGLKYEVGCQWLSG